MGSIRPGPRRAPAPVRRAARLLVPAALALGLLAGRAAAADVPATDEPASAAALPLSESQRLTELGKFFDLSDPPSQDFEKARDLYCRAAALGNGEAVQRLGWLYFRGRGVAADEATAATLFRWAGQLGETRGPAAAAMAGGGGPAVPPPCLARLGIHSVEVLRDRQRAAAVPARPVPSATVDAPAAFRPGAAPAEQRRIAQLVVQHARLYRLDPRLVLAIVRAESNFDAAALSPKNAQGLMQLIPETARRFSVSDPFDAAENIKGGMAYVRWLLAYYRGDVTLTLAAYNAGEGAVDRFRGVPPFPETLSYVQRIRALYPFDRHPFDLRVLAAGERSWVDRDVAQHLDTIGSGTPQPR